MGLVWTNEIKRAMAVFVCFSCKGGDLLMGVGKGVG